MEPWTSQLRYPAILVRKTFVTCLAMIITISSDRNIPLWLSSVSAVLKANLFFIPGVYVILFGYCTAILGKRKLAQRMLLGALISLFLLASADIAVTLFFFFRVLSTDPPQPPWNTTLMYKFALYIVAKYVSMVSGVCLSHSFDSAIANGVLVRNPLTNVSQGLSSLDIFQISRCYAVWKNRRILIGPIVLTICGTGMTYYPKMALLTLTSLQSSALYL